MATDMKIEGDEMTARLVPSRLPASLLASATLHALALLVVIRFVGSIAAPGDLPRAEIIPVSLVSLPGGGGGNKGDGTPAPPPAAPVAAPVPPVPAAPPKPIPAETMAKKRSPVKPRAQPAPPPVAAPAASAATAAIGVPSTAGGNGTGHGTTGGGDGSGGDGSGGAQPAYGSNPRPPYPLAARRMGIEGRVLLEVIVRPDGSPATVSVRQSSGHQMLDDSAADTVRARWRFIPARRGGVPVESTVTVPIRFRISEG